ncbi:hypothetical protein [Plastoroseomonas arctica]|uniref:Uncharacterized protein n=1 Tax=Plastoroseomonas arctica TaxID=1509237 RepID=A0AAF1KQW6_9PROT|nr:hypothetical protein [Plastoroseomonas arctica]MBR0653652.1 hypothetical protein [Plastoroseomonas arctica]
MSVVPFPPRASGAVLQEALDAAYAASELEAKAWEGLAMTPWGESAGQAHEAVMQAALAAATPILRNVTSAPAMVLLIANAMAEEANIRLRVRGVL